MSSTQETDVPPQEIDVPGLVDRLDKLVVALSIRNAPALWDAEQMAEWFGLTAKVVKYNVTTRPGFPKPVAPTGTKECKKLWFADEVIEWARLNRGVIPIGRKAGRPRAAA